jgi:hypothetical protein
VFRLKYRVNGQLIEEAIRLQRFPQPFGGHRWYFICPSTGRNCQCLYLPPGGATHFRSREAFSSRLLYLSQTLSSQARYQEQARHIARRVFECWPAEWRRENEDKWDFPPKPKWMRWKTYNQLDARVMDYESAADGLAVYRVLRLAGKLGGTH